MKQPSFTPPAESPGAGGLGRRSWGIDVSKGWLDIFQLPEQTHWQVANDATGWATLVAQAAAADPAWIVLEASGHLEVGVAVALDAVGRTPVILNPLVSRRFAQSHGQLAKTDRVDAALLARFGVERQPAPRPLPAELARDLGALLAVREDLVTQRAAAKTRLQQARAVVRPHLKRQIADLTTQIDTVAAELATLVASDPAWAAKVAQLATVPGIGLLTATLLAVSLPELGQATAKQLAALVGVAPVADDSGRRQGRRSIRGGRRPVRKALYQAVFTAVCNPWCRGSLLQRHYAQLTARGKPRKVALVACMRRLLGLLTAMVRTGCTWDQLQVHARGQPAMAA
jgi:transposase